MADLYTISLLSEENARKITTWSYIPPFNLYDLAPEHLSNLLNPDYRYHQVLDQNGSLVGYCCFGLDAQVPGGLYSESEPGVLDIGVGLKPELTGQSLGREFVGAVLNYAEVTFQPDIIRVTIADFNQRSLKTFQSLGFRFRGHITRELVGVEFSQLERPVRKV